MIPRTFISFKWDDKAWQEELMRMISNIDTLTPLAIDEWGEMLTDSIRSFTPHKTGESQASIGKYDPSLIVATADPITWQRARENAVYKMRRIRQDTWELVVGSNYDVVVWLNYGTEKMKPLHMFERGQAAALPYLKPAVQKALDASIRPSGWITAGRWTTVSARQTFNPAVGGGGSLLDARRRVRISPA